MSIRERVEQARFLYEFRKDIQPATVTEIACDIMVVGSLLALFIFPIVAVLA